MLPNRFAPNATPIQESPASASVLGLQFQQYGYGIGIAPEPSWSHKSQIEQPQSTQAPQAPQANDQKIDRSSSPYGIPESTQTHPAYYAPIASTTLSSQFQQQRLSSPPLPYQQPSMQPKSQPQQFTKSNRVSTLKAESDEKQPQDVKVPLRSPTIPTSNSPRAYQQPIFSPGSLAGPNGVAPDLHQPGQILHPNMTFPSTTGRKSEWNHGMCECSGDVGTCVTGIFCPCILDSRTAYRLNRRSAKKDPTDLLGFNSCNSRCTVMSIFGLCGLCCKPFALLLLLAFLTPRFRFPTPHIENPDSTCL
jgi:Cys-rich protein (TIGR01571 family)